MRRRKEECCMHSRFLRLAIGFAVVTSSLGCAHIGASKAPALTTQSVIAPRIERPDGVLRVCSDPNNLPFSNEQQQGFENKIAQVLARDLNERLEYTWWAQRRGFFRN